VLRKMKKGIFITFEGIDGCGKSIQADLLRDFIKDKGKEIILVREPGGTEISEQIRSILLNPENIEMDSSTETILLSASRAQLTRQVIIPSLKGGILVICDRYADSTLAYQGYGRGFSIEWLEKINEFATDGQIPDATILIDVPIKTALHRLKKKLKDRLERESTDFLRRVREGYLTLAEKQTKRYIVIDGLKSIQTIHNEIKQKLEDFSLLREFNL